MAKSKIVKASKKIAVKATNCFEKISNTVIKVYTKIEDNFIERYLARDGETIEKAKKRIKTENEKLM